MTPTLLSDRHRVARYCKPSAVGENGLPLAAAFRLRTGEDHLSVNWLEHYGAPDVNAAVGKVRDAFHAKGFTLRPNGRFAVLEVGATTATVLEATRHDLLFKHLPLPDDESHSGIFGYGPDDLAVATEIRALVTANLVRPAIIPDDAAGSR